MPAGRPPIFKDADELHDMIEQFFAEEKDKPTITGLCLHLGFESRQSFYDYEEKDEFSYTIRNARLRIENGYEKKLFDPACTGAIFALKNFGWKDKTEQEHSGNMGINWIENKNYQTKPND